MLVRQYKLPKTAQVFSLSLPFATNPGDWIAIGIVSLNGSAELLVQEDESVKSRSAWKFALVRTGDPIPTAELRYGCSYLGSFESDGDFLHLYGPKTRQEGGKLC